MKTMTMDKQYIEQHDISGKYLRGQLTPEEAIAYEEFLMEQPEWVEQLEMDSLLTRGMSAAVKLSQQKNKGRFWWTLHSPWAASFATLLLCLIAFSLLYEGEDSLDDLIAANTRQVLLSPSRGVDASSNMPIVALDADERYFELLIQPGDLKSSHFEVAVHRLDNQKVMLSKRSIAVMPNGDIKLLLSSKAYPDGQYKVSVQGADSQAKPETFYFGVRHKSGQ